MINTDGMNRHLQVVMASDSNYAEFVATFIVSVFRSNKSFNKITIHLLSCGIGKEVFDRIKRHVPENGGEIVKYEIQNLHDLLKVQVPDTIAVSIYARLFLSSLLPQSLDRILYVDCDVVVKGDLLELWNVDFGTDWVAGVLDTLYSDETKTAVGISSNDYYVNSGILMINLKAWREHHVQEKFLCFLSEHDGKVVHHDQGIINAVCNGHKKIVPPKYNVMSAFYSHPYKYIKERNNPFYTSRELKEAIDSPVMLHFTEGFYGRPWVENCRHPMRKVFCEAHDRTEWKGGGLRADKRSLYVRLISWIFLHLPLQCYNVTQKVARRCSLLWNNWFQKKI